MKDLKDLRIYIPTYKRMGVQSTVHYIPPNLQGQTSLVCHENEAAAHANYLDKAGLKISIVVVPDKIEGIANKRQWLLENTDSRYVGQLDDDLIFAKRLGDGVKLRKINHNEYGVMTNLFQTMRNWLDVVPHCGIGARSGNNRKPLVTAPGKLWSIFFQDLDLVRKLKIRFNEVQLMEDYHVTLSLLDAGYTNAVCNYYTVDQAKGSGAAGGCSTYRDNEMQKSNAERLAQLWEGRVKTVEKDNKTGWGGMDKRTDVTVQWLKTLGKENRPNERFLKELENLICE